jgi:hypothetical protein
VFFSESRQGNKRGNYVPLQILLLLLMKEEICEEEALKFILRECILMHLKLRDD